jgi:glutamate--cysteine ligase
MLERGEREVALTEWGAELLQSFAPVAALLDATHQTSDYSDAVRGAQALLQQPELLPSARVLAVMKQDFDSSFTAFGCAQSQQVRAKLLSLPFSAGQQAKFAAMTEQSLRDQQAIEAADRIPFETYRQQYVSAERLALTTTAIAPALAAV